MWAQTDRGEVLMRASYIFMVGVMLGGACGGHKAMNNSTSTVPMITTHDEARAAVGKIVQVRGTVQREKLGDTINAGDLAVRCVDFQFPDALVGGTATAEGKLEIMTDEPATTSPSGEISQGTEDGGSSFVIRNCVAR
jgi:hypothetical protein